MSATIRIKILGGTDIEHAYEGCAQVSGSLGAISIETTFNGIEMFFHNQTLKEWCDEYHRRIAIDKNKEDK